MKVTVGQIVSTPPTAHSLSLQVVREALRIVAARLQAAGLGDRDVKVDALDLTMPAPITHVATPQERSRAARVLAGRIIGQVGPGLGLKPDEGLKAGAPARGDLVHAKAGPFLRRSPLRVSTSRAAVRRASSVLLPNPRKDVAKLLARLNGYSPGSAQALRGLWSIRDQDITSDNAEAILAAAQRLDPKKRVYRLRQRCLQKNPQIIAPRAYTDGALPADKPSMKAYIKQPENWCPQRSAIHQRILKEEMAKAKEVAERMLSASGGRPTILMMRGNSGSGKTYTLQNSTHQAIRGLNVTDATKTGDPEGLLNPDDIKYRLSKEFEGGKATSSQVHSEGSMLTEKIIDSMLQQRLSMVLDKRFGLAEEVQKEVCAAAKAHGYRIVMIDMDASLDTSCKRVSGRELGGKAPNVAFKAVAHGLHEIRGDRPLIRNLCEQGEIDEYLLFKSDGPKMGTLIAEKTADGTFKIYDEDLWKEATEFNQAEVLAAKDKWSEYMDIKDKGIQPTIPMPGTTTPGGPKVVAAKRMALPTGPVRSSPMALRPHGSTLRPSTSRSIARPSSALLAPPRSTPKDVDQLLKHLQTLTPGSGPALRGLWRLEDKDVTTDNSERVLTVAQRLDPQKRVYKLRQRCMQKNPQKITTPRAYTDGNLPPDKSSMKAYIKKPENWCPKRTDIHARIIDQETKKAETVATRMLGASRNIPTVLMMRGNSGSGKTYTLKNSTHQAIRGLNVTDPTLQGDPEGLLNPDDIKYRLAKEFEGGRATSSQVHSEGSMITEKLIDSMLQQRRSMVLDKRFGLAEEVQKEVCAAAKQHGYRIVMIDMDASLDTSCKRVAGRELGGKAPNVSFKAVAHGFQEIRGDRPLIKKLCDEGDIDAYFLFKSDGPKMGTLIAEKTSDGSFKVYDDDLWKEACEAGQVEILASKDKWSGYMDLKDAGVQPEAAPSPVAMPK